MKRTPLKKGKMRSWNSTLRPVSEKRASMNSTYHALVKERRSNDDGKICEKCKAQLPTEPHHPSGRRTLRTILDFRFICRACHDEIHGNEKKALEDGWLTKEFFISKR